MSERKGGPAPRGVTKQARAPAVVVPTPSGCGCGLAGVLLRIVLPLMVPGLVAVAGLSFLIGWGEFVFGLTLAKEPGVQPVTVLLNSFVGQYGTAWGALMATTAVVCVPVVRVFAIFQRFIVGGLTAGSIKG